MDWTLKWEVRLLLVEKNSIVGRLVLSEDRLESNNLPTARERTPEDKASTLLT